MSGGTGHGVDYNQLMYSAVLLVHSWLRWVVLVLAILAILRALRGGAWPWSRDDDRAGLLFTAALDLQFLLGLLLYFVLSPITRTALSDFGSAMQVSGTRFWAVEHVFGMLVALVLAHVGRARVKSIQDARRKRRVAAIFYILALVAMVAAIPWPGMPNGRPLLRW